MTSVRKAFSREEVKAMIASGEVVPWTEAMRCRVRYFTDGGVLGSRGFVDAFFQSYRDKFGARRVDGARKLRGIAIGDVFCLRALRVEVFG